MTSGRCDRGRPWPTGVLAGALAGGRFAHRIGDDATRNVVIVVGVVLAATLFVRQLV